MRYSDMNERNDRTITWLHISDLHTNNPKHGWDYDIVTGHLVKDLKKMHNDYELYPDFIFFTGDAAFGRKEHESDEVLVNQYMRAHDFMKAVRTTFGDNFPRKNIFIIPGNHDLHAAGKIPERPAEADYEYWPHEEDLDPGYRDEEKEFVAGLPDYWIIPDHKYGIMLSHYVSPNISGSIMGFYQNINEFDSHFQLMQENNCTISFTGHTHVKGFYTVTSAAIEHYGYEKLHLRTFPVIIGIPAVTRNNLRTGFCIFDTDNLHLQVIKLN